MPMLPLSSHFWVRMIVILSFVISALAPHGVRAEPTREFIMSATYGTLAGTLVGAASLAFTSQPGENLRNIARGASLGLYAGILLGVYVVYIVPAQLERENNKQNEPPPEEEQKSGSLLNGPAVYPLITAEHGLEGIFLRLSRWSY